MLQHGKSWDLSCESWEKDIGCAEIFYIRRRSRHHNVGSISGGAGSMRSMLTEGWQGNWFHRESTTTEKSMIRFSINIFRKQTDSGEYDSGGEEIRNETLMVSRDDRQALYSSACRHLLSTLCAQLSTLPFSVFTTASQKRVKGFRQLESRHHYL